MPGGLENEMKSGAENFKFSGEFSVRRDRMLGEMEKCLRMFVPAGAQRKKYNMMSRDTYSLQKLKGPLGFVWFYRKLGDCD